MFVNKNMFNLTIAHVVGAAIMNPCTQLQSNIIAAHMVTLHQACHTRHHRFLVLEKDAGSVLKPLEKLSFPADWCCINVCPTNTQQSPTSTCANQRPPTILARLQLCITQSASAIDFDHFGRRLWTAASRLTALFTGCRARTEPG